MTNNSISLVLRIIVIQFVIGILLALLATVISGWHSALSIACGSFISIFGTWLLAIVALKKITSGEEILYVRIFSRMQVIRLFLLALVLSLTAVFLRLPPIFLMAGFIITHFVSWIFVFTSGRKEKYMWT